MREHVLVDRVVEAYRTYLDAKDYWMKRRGNANGLVAFDKLMKAVAELSEAIGV